MSIPVFSREAVLAAVSPLEAYAAVRDAFVAHHRGEWSMQPKVYVTNYPAGDFRAMPALGGGHALLKWVTSFPANPARGLPTVTGVVLLSNAENGELEAVLLGEVGPVCVSRVGVSGQPSIEQACSSERTRRSNADMHRVELPIAHVEYSAASVRREEFLQTRHRSIVQIRRRRPNPVERACPVRQ